MMLRLFCRFQVWLKQQEGATTAEYIVLGVVIVVGLLATMKSLRQALITQLTSVVTAITDASK